MGIDITRPLCGIQRDINHPSSGFGRKPKQVWVIAQCVEENVISEQAAKRSTIETGLNREDFGKRQTHPALFINRLYGSTRKAKR